MENKCMNATPIAPKVNTIGETVIERLSTELNNLSRSIERLDEKVCPITAQQEPCDAVPQVERECLPAYFASLRSLTDSLECSNEWLNDIINRIRL